MMARLAVQSDAGASVPFPRKIIRERPAPSFAQPDSNLRIAHRRNSGGCTHHRKLKF
jgi:hypothetical protein